ncbi:MAG: hypothetical protein ABJA90_00740 [Ginsengibacter sp.]
MKGSTLLFAVMFFATTVFCQDSYISLNNETVNGTIVHYKEWSKNPSSVQFKEAATGNIINLTPSNCKGFNAGSSDIYISYFGMRILNSNDIENKHALQSDSLIKDSVQVFLREIYRFNTYVLYKLFDDKRTNFYISDNGVIKELEYYEQVDENKHINFDYAYKNYLLLLLADKNVADLRRKVESLKYEENSLINFLAGAFNDKFHSSEKLRNKYPTQILLGVAADVNFGSITRTNGTSYQQTALSPALDIGVRIYSQRNLGRLFFQPSINVTALMHTFNNNQLKAKATLVSAKIGAGYAFKNKPNLSVYGVAQTGLTFLFGYKTAKGSNSRYINDGSPTDKITVYPEVGATINKKINIALAGTLPIRISFLSDYSYVYKISQACLIVRYVL